MADYIKELPNDLFTEKTVLGLMIIDNDVATAMLSNLNIDDFYIGNIQNRTIFSAIKRVKDRGGIIDIASLISELTIMKQLDSVTEEYVYSLISDVLSTKNYEYYINILKDFTILRNLISCVRDVEKEYETI